MDCSTSGLTVQHQLPEFTQTHVHWVGDAIQPSHPLSSASPSASIFPRIRVFSNESVLHIRWPKYWSFSFNSSPSDKHSGLISFRMDCLDLLAVQGTLKNLLQHRNSKTSILQRSAFFIVQLSHPYITNKLLCKFEILSIAYWVINYYIIFTCIWPTVFLIIAMSAVHVLTKYCNGIYTSNFFSLLGL